RSSQHLVHGSASREAPLQQPTGRGGVAAIDQEPSGVPSLPVLYALCDRDVCEGAGWGLTGLALACVDGRTRLLPVRDKRASSARLLDTVHEILERVRSTGTIVIVNDRADVAGVARAGGVHVGQEDLSPARVRSVVGEAAVVGFSTHTRVQIDRAVA